MSIFIPSFNKTAQHHRFTTTMPKIATFPSRLLIPSLLVLSIVLMFITYQNLGMIKVVAGPQDKRFISGVHDLEPLEHTKRLMRWTTDETSINLPLPAAWKTLIYDLNVANHYPIERSERPYVEVVINSQTMLAFTPARESRHYQMLIPPQEQAGWALPITLRSTTIVPVTDPRPLGVVFIESRLISTGGFPNLPPLWQVAACLIGVIAAYITFRGIGATPLLGWGFATILALLWAHILAHFPMQVAPFTMRLAGLCVLGAIYGITVHIVQETIYDEHWISPLRLPILMGVAYWLMPMYQLIMTVDGARGVSPYPPTLWVVGGALVMLLIGLIVLAFARLLYHWIMLVLTVLALASIAHLIVMLEFVMGNSGVATIAMVLGFTFVAISSKANLRITVLAGIIAYGAIIFSATFFDPWQGRSGPDFWILFKGARDWYQGGSLYNVLGIKENHFGHSFKVPPFYGMLFVPFVQKDGLTILFWHRMMNMMLISIILLIMIRAWNISLFSSLGAGMVMLFNMRPMADTVAYGQIDVILLLLLTLALIASQHHYEKLAGTAIALATLFKLYPILLLAFFIVKRQWRALYGFVLAMVIFNGIAIMVMGWDMHAIYLFEVIPNIRGGTAWVENQTLNGFLSRFFAPDISATIFVHPIVTILTYGGFVAATLLAMAFAWMPTERTEPRYMLQYSFFVILIVLVVPAAWMHYETIVILTFATILIYAAELGLSRWIGALTGMSYALIAYGNQWSFYLNQVMGGLTVAGLSYKFYGLVLLLIVVIGCLREQEYAA